MGILHPCHGYVEETLKVVSISRMKALAKAVADRSKKSFAAKVELQDLKRLDAEWLACFTAANVTYTDVAAKAAWSRQAADHTGKLRKGEPFNRAYSLEDFQADYTTRQQNAKHGMAEAATEAQPIIAKILERFLAAVEATLDEVERAEIADYGEWGLAYTPSPKVLALRQLKDGVRTSIPVPGQSAYGRPGQSVPFLDLL